MGFIRSPIYYFLCAVALGILVILLIRCQIKAKRPSQKVSPTPPKPVTTQKPRYAAGDDMDRINRNAYTVKFNHKHSKAPAITGISLFCLIIILTIFQLPNQKNQEITHYPNTTVPSTLVPVQSIPSGEIELHIISTEFSRDLTKIFVTYEYVNNSEIDIYSIVPTVNILNTYGEVMQSEKAETIEKILRGERKEIITSMELNTNVIQDISKVTITSTYEN